MDEQIENTVETVLRRANLLRSGATLLVALSGGADSVVLLRAVCALRPENGLNVTAAHVEHGLRGARALADAHFCERLCAELGVPLSLDHADLPGDMRAPGAETRAREARYRLLLSRARACRADALLLAHHQDDQAETVLARLIRGGGAQGLAGMREISRMEGVTLARPLLSLPKQALLKALGGLPYCEDETNAEPCCQRNRLRAEVLPLLAAENPRAAAHIARSAALLAMDEDCLQAQAEALLTVARVDRPPYYYVRRATLRAAPAAVAVRALRAFVLMGAARLQRADAPTSAGPPPTVTDASALAGLPPSVTDASAPAGQPPSVTDASAPAGQPPSVTDASALAGQPPSVTDASALAGPPPSVTDASALAGPPPSAPSDAPAGCTAAIPDDGPPACGTLGGEGALSAEDSLLLLRLLTGPENGTLNLPCALRAVATANHLHLVRMEGGDPLVPAQWPVPSALSPANGGREARLGSLRLRQTAYNPTAGPRPDGLRTVALPDERLARAVLRLPRPGDTIRPFGAGGGKPFRRYLTDRKLDPPFRSRVPVLCDGAEVLWAVGLCASEATRLSGGPATLLTAEGWLPWAEGIPETDGRSQQEE